MRNQPVTEFWTKALESLPAAVRARYAHHFAAAERWELRLDALVELWTRFKTGAQQVKREARAA